MEVKLPLPSQKAEGLTFNANGAEGWERGVTRVEMSMLRPKNVTASRKRVDAKLGNRVRLLSNFMSLR